MLLPAVAIGFHGCDREVGEKVLLGDQEIRPSENSYDWLGRGAYFWEGDPHRAKTWAEYLRDNPAASRSKIRTPFVVGAILKLGSCLDLTHSAHLEIVRAAFVELDETFKMTGRTLPQNKPAGKGDADLVKRYRDRLVLDPAKRDPEGVRRSRINRIACFQRGSEEFREEMARRKARAAELVLRKEPPAYGKKF